MNTMYIVFAAILAISVAFVAVAAENKLQDGDEDIKGLLGMRPDLADELDPVDEDGNRIPQDKSSESGPSIPQAESNAAIKKQNEEVGCINECKDTDQSCRARCLGRELSDEEIVERTQKCHNDCKDEPDELIQMCIQKCTYYLMNPEEHNLEDDDTSTSTDEGGLLPDSPHIRTRIRLIGPDGLPVVSTVDYPANQPSEVSNAISAAAETASDTWTPMYRVSIRT
ncbi:hypothetical protein H4217_006422 [Coemansia sp. RSA 1939]|nr:hypothetical protein H4217_006422 [Coemansia sp. RSA 1939]